MTSISILGGTGALGAALAVRLAKAGHEIHIGSRDPEKARGFVAGVLAETPGLNMTGDGLAISAAAAELCVLAVPYAAHGSTLEQIKAAVAGKVVIDTTVPLMPPKVGTVQLPAAGCAAVEAQQALGPEARVVSALQTIGAEKLAAGQAVDGDVLVASDDAEAAAQVCALLAEIGLRSWHVGPLANSAAAEAMTSVLIQINRRYKRVQAGIRITGKPKEEAEDHSRSHGLSVHPLNGMPMFQAGDDLAGAIAGAIGNAGLAPQDGDVIVVAQKAVSKVEGRTVALDGVSVSAKARELAKACGKPEAIIELIAAESAEVMRVRDGLIITRHRLGTVAANAGIDTSNVGDPAGPETVLLWPNSPDASAAGLRAALEARFGVKLAVIVSDSLGRAWRVGTAGTAIGVSGMKPLRDRRGETDLFGRVLQATVVAVADEIAAAASLVIGEAAEGVPAVLVRGAVYDAAGDEGVGDLLRPLDEDLFPVSLPKGHVVALCGGVGGAKMAFGLARMLAPDDLTIVVNTGDDFEHLGLSVSPDIDTVAYTLSELSDRERGWGLAGETWNFMSAVRRLGGEDWFQLGDHDLAMHVERTRMLAAGESLSAVTRTLTGRLGIECAIIPMADHPVRTFVDTTDGPLAFQHYFVREQCRPAVHAVRYVGAEDATVAEAALAALSRPDLSTVLICPSNPYLSIGPILAVPGMRKAINAAAVPCVAVSPIVGGEALKGPSAKMMREMGVAPTPLSVAAYYEGLIDGLIIDTVDGDQVAGIEGLGVAALVTPTVMRSDEDRLALARDALAFAGSLAPRPLAKAG